MCACDALMAGRKGASVVSPTPVIHALLERMMAWRETCNQEVMGNIAVSSCDYCSA